LRAAQNVLSGRMWPAGSVSAVDEYVTKLRSLSSTCEFGALTDDLIRDRLLLGTKLDQVRPKLMSEADVTLQRALEICRSCEQTQRQLRDIDNPTEKAYAVSRSASQRKGGLPNCKYCDRKHEFIKDKCPACGKPCRNCGKPHHFAICCRVKRNEQCSWVLKEHIGSPLYYASNTVCQVSPKGTQWFVDLQLRLDKREKPVVMSSQLNCGSTCNIVSSKHLDLIRRGTRISLNHTMSKLQLYDGTTMSVRGTIDIWCMYKGQEYLLTFHILDGSAKPLLSADTCELFGLLTFHVQQAELCDTLGSFADVFQGLGCLPGDYHIEVDPDVRPVQHMLRNVPVAVQQEIRQRLQELVNMKFYLL